MKIIWEIDGEYVMNGTYETEIDEGDLEDYETQEEKEEFIRGEIQADFELES